MEQAAIKSPQQQLADDWLALNAGIAGKSSLHTTLWSWLLSNANYTPAFWSQSIAPSGATPLQALTSSTLSAAELVWPLWLAEAGDQAAVVLNTPSGTPPAVLLHTAWRAGNFPGRTGNDKTDAFVLEIMKRTDPRHWTWLDPTSAHPGDGILSEIMSAIQARSNPSLQNMVELLARAYPRAAAPSSSHWKKASTVPMVTALLASGHSINDPVTIGSLTVPAWEWLWMSGNTNRNARLSAHNVMTHAEKWGVSDMEKLSALNANHASWQRALVPSDRRATTGYVARVMAQPGADDYGRTALTYLLQNRSDLLNLLFEKSFKQKALHAAWMVPDRCGYTALTHAILQSPDLAQKLQLCLTSSGSPGVWGFEDTGWWRHEMQNKRWWPIVCAHSHYGSGMNPSPDRLATMNWPVEMLFGPPAVQKQWVKQWEEWLPKAASGWELMSASSKSLMARQIGNFFIQSPHFSASMDPELHAQLTMATYLLLGKGRPHVSEIGKLTGFGDNSLPSKIQPTNDPPPPSVWTKSMLSIINDSSILLPLTLRGSYGKSNPDHISVWKAAAEQFTLAQAVGSDPHHKATAIRRM